MKIKETLDLGAFSNKTVLYFELNWFDLNEDAQKYIYNQVQAASGEHSNFLFKNSEIRIEVTKNNGKEI